MDTIKRKCKVVMLSTNEKSIIYTFKNGLGNKDSIHVGEYNICHPEDKERKNQHIYIISNEEINEGDIVLHNNENEYVSKVLGFNMDAIKLEDAQRWTKDCKKIIATTDSKYPHLPAPSKSFIEKYCKQGGIDQIMVEYKKGYRPKRKGVTELQDNKGFYQWGPAIKWEIGKQKIVISKVKDSWSKDEVENIVRMAMQSKGYTPEYEVREFCNNNLK